MNIERSIPELEAWYAQYDDESYRRESPDAYSNGLRHTADALLKDGAIDLDDWQKLTDLVDDAERRGLGDAVEAQVDDPTT